MNQDKLDERIQKILDKHSESLTVPTGALNTAGTRCQAEILEAAHADARRALVEGIEANDVPG